MLASLPSDTLCHIFSFVQDEIQDNMRIVLTNLKYIHKWGRRYVQFIKSDNLGVFCLNKYQCKPKILSIFILD